MAQVQSLNVQLIAATQFQAPPDVDWSADAEATDAEALVEFAGRACYESFDKPNERTAANKAYLNHILEVGHHALLEHASATMYIRGISRSCTHELMRHRHFSFSQLSQRFVHMDQANIVVPPAIAGDEDLTRLLRRASDDARFVYEELLQGLEEKLADEPNALLRKKQARQAARSILPNATETRVVVSGNMRTWRHFIAHRASEHADEEIRAVAIACLDILKGVAPALFSDFMVSELADGSKMASSPYVG